MPKQVKEIKEFLQLVRRVDARGVKVKKNGTQTKFKVRTSKYLYTLVMNDPKKAQKVRDSFPRTAKVEEI